MDTNNLMSELLVELYQGARTQPMGEFQAWALERVRGRIPFEHGSLGTAPYGETDLPAVRNLGLEALRGVAVVPFVQGEMLVGCVRNPGVPAVHLNLIRQGEATFSDDERQFAASLLPHLAEALAIHRRLRVVELEARGEMVALIDRRGQLQVAALGFELLMRQEWPTFDARIPASVLGREHEPAPFNGKTVHLQFEVIGAELLVRAQASTPLESLTRREQAIAEHFTRGLSYKAVANKLGISPATVRNHLSRIYGKLGVHDKGELAMLVYSRPRQVTRPACLAS